MQQETTVACDVVAETGDQSVRSEGSAATGPDSVHRVREVAPVHCSDPLAPEPFLVTEVVAPATPLMVPVVRTGSDCVAASELMVSAAGDRLQDVVVVVHDRNPFHRLSDRSHVNHTVAPADEADSMAGAEVLTAGTRAAGNRLHVVVVAEEQTCCTHCQRPDDRRIGQVAGEEHEWRYIVGHKQTEGTDIRKSEEQVAAEKHRDCCDCPYRGRAVVVHDGHEVRTAESAEHVVRAEVRDTDTS